MRKRSIVGIILIFTLGSVLSSAQTSETQPSFYFGGKRLYVGMSRAEAIENLSRCCTLSPSADSIDKEPAASANLLGHFILGKNGPAKEMLGAIFFSGDKVVRITRPLAPDVDSSSQDLITFMRAVKRSVPEGESTAIVSLQPERTSNAESYLLSVVFSNGKGLEIHIATLDKPDINDRRDFITLDETLQRAP